MRSRTYSLILLSPIVTLAAVAFATMCYIQPNFGADLTRIGGYTNRDFGWNLPQKVTADNSISMAKDLAANNAYYDVVVLGDSFSHFEKPRLNRWQQIFSSATGLSLITYHFNHVWLDDYLNSSAFQKHPPKILIMEFVERNIETFVKAGRMAECSDDERVDDKAIFFLQRNPVLMRPLVRPIGIASLDEAMNFLRINSKASHKVSHYYLTSNMLFSNHAANELLTLRDDRLKYSVASSDIKRLGCYLRQRQQRAEANGITHFVVMVPPDKTSLYCPYIRKKQNIRCESVVADLFVSDLHAVRLDQVFAKALNQGVVDLYLPNDTHWGYLGSELAANSLRDWFRPPDETGSNL